MGGHGAAVEHTSSLRSTARGGQVAAEPAEPSGEGAAPAMDPERTPALPASGFAAAQPRASGCCHQFALLLKKFARVKAGNIKVTLLALFYVWTFSTMRPRRRDRKTGKPQSALNVVAAVR